MAAEVDEDELLVLRRLCAAGFPAIDELDAFGGEASVDGEVDRLEDRIWRRWTKATATTAC